MISGAALPMLGLPSVHSIPSTMDFVQAHHMMHHGIAVHFHLSASINAETDIPLVPALKHHNFRVFWLNNKEMFFTQQAETILQEICRKGMERDDSGDNFDEGGNRHLPKSHSHDDNHRLGADDDSSQPSLSSAASSTSLADGNFTPSLDMLDRKLEQLLRDWHKTPDILVSLHPIDGSFLVWSIDWLDEHSPGSFRQAQVSFSSCIPGAIPLADATSMSSPNLYLFPLEKLASNRAAMMTKHHNGSLNLWTLSFGDDSKFCQLLSVSHAKRASGHRFRVREMSCHPVLPLILTAASHSFTTNTASSGGIDDSEAGGPKSQNYCSELILWRVDPIGPLCKSGGVVEIARINSSEVDAFSHVAWVPGLLPSTSLFSNSGCFVASDGTNLRVYQAVLDASNLLAEISSVYRKRKASLNDSVVSLSSSSSLSSVHDEVEDPADPDLFAIVSQQSTSRPGCILQLDRIDNQNWGEVSFIEVFRDDIEPARRGSLDYKESFHVVLIVNKIEIHAWRIEISTPSHGLEPHEFYDDDISLNISNPHHNSTSTHEDDFPVGASAADTRIVNGLPSIITTMEKSNKKSFLNITVNKLVQQSLGPVGSDLRFSFCTGHFVCGSSYALIVTSKDSVKLLKLQKRIDGLDPPCLHGFDNIFKEWNSLGACKEKGQLLQASAAYSGRIACVYKLDRRTEKETNVSDEKEKVSGGGSPTSNSDNNNESPSCAVTVYECESTGGTEWMLEDTIELHTGGEVTAVHLEWIPKHDAQHILALAISDMICLFAHVSQEPTITFGAKVLPSSTSCKSQYWLPLHAFKLSSADGLNPFPVRFGWIHAVCVVAMRNEMQVYSQWALENLTVSFFKIPSRDVSSLIPASTKMTRKETEIDEQPNKPQIELSLLSGSVGLFQYTRHCFPVLPQYHPTQLMGMLNSGKVRWVRVILGHLVRCLGGSGGSLKRQNSLLHDEDGRQRSFSRSRCLSISYSGAAPPSPLEHRNSVVFQSDELSFNYAEMRTIPPVPLWMLLNAEKDDGQGASDDKSNDYKELFNAEAVDEPLDESVFDDFLDDDDDGMGGGSEKKRRRSTSGDNQALNFGQRQSRQLSRVLTHTQIPGLTSVDQMHLLALADTVASIGTKLDHHRDVTQSHLHDGTPDSLDECGLRFLIVVRHYSYLIKCLPPAQRVPIQKLGISTSDIVWAFHSESQEDILSLIPAYHKGEATWSQMRELGAGFWLRNNQTLRICMERIAKYAFQKTQDPMDAAIFYLAMKKKTLLWGLYRSKRDEKMALFFSNDFAEERWRKAALKNAYALLGKQRFEHAAAFFLLAGSLKDALEVCLAKLKDVQLALVVSRLYEGGDLDPTPPPVRTLLQDEILKTTRPVDEGCEPDPFLCSMALWMLKEFQSSLDILLKTRSMSSRVFNFYVFLRNHPLLVRQNKAKGTLALSSQERNLYFFTAHEHYARGCPALAIHVLSQLPKERKAPNSIIGTPIKSPVKADSRIESGILSGHDDDDRWTSGTSNKLNDSGTGTSVTDFAAPPKQEPLDFDWATPLATGPSKKIVEDELKLDWDDDEHSGEEEEEAPKPAAKKPTFLVKESLIKNTSKDMGKSISKEENSIYVEEGEEDLNDPHTMIAVELRLASCMKLMSEEIVNMAGQLEGTELRLHLYAWLEKQVPTLKEICRYTSDDEDLDTDEWSAKERSLTPRLDTHGSGLHEIILSEKLDLEWKMGIITRRSRWLRANRHLLATLLSFARLHAHALAPVHIELVFLLDELQKEKSTGTGPSLVSPLPYLHSEFPLLSAVANPAKTAVSFIQSSARDILQTMSELIAIPVFPLAKDVVDNVKPDPRKTSMAESAATKTHSIAGTEIPEETGGEDGLNSREGGIGDDNPEDTEEQKQSHDSPTKKGGDDDTFVDNDPKDEMSAIVCDWKLVLVLRDSGVALSSCLFQALSDSEGTEAKEIGVQLLFTPRRRRWSSAGTSGSGDGQSGVISTPDKWPGVAILRGMLSREEDGETPKLKFLLVECYAAVYVSIFVHAIAICDAVVLYRILAKKMDAAGFASIFGGGTKKQIKMSVIQQLNEEKPTFREKFVPPDIPIYGYLMGKPKPRSDEHDGKLVFPDSEDEDEDEEHEEEEEEDDGFGWEPKNQEMKPENLQDDPFSYAWRLMRLAAVKLAKNELKRIVGIAGIDFNELSHISPYLDGLIRVFTVWQERLFREVEGVSPAPMNFLPNTVVESLAGPPIHKYRALLEPTNTPFPQKRLTFGLRRLWNMLVREDNVQDYFIRFVFGKKRAEDTMSLWEMSMEARMKTSDRGEGAGEEEEEDQASNAIGPVRIVHKEHESISAFCVNQSSAGLMAISTPKEIQELDISVLLNMESWKFEDQCELDLINLYKDPETLSSSSYLVVQSPSDRALLSNIERPQKGSHSLILKHKVDGIRRMASHATLPLYLSGSQDGSVRLWEFSHAQPVSVPRPAGTFAKVTKIRFHGNKFGVCDGDGRLSLWQIGTNARPFYTAQCHTKQTSDFVFLGSSSLVATAGMSTDSKNVAMWDTLMPMKKAQIASFVSHEQGCVALAYAEEHQSLISAGKKGAICIWDIRQRSLRHKFQGHESAIKCMSLDPSEEYFCTGAADGDIKVWDFNGKPLAVFLGEHLRSGFFKNIPGQGVTQLSLDAHHRMFSCGSDGSVKIRALKDRFD
ncbi:DmX-like protein 2 [Folsomia candida]|uniref:DmX-like protein 2 n=1 Tax=Folsomia candida TaxID=158441 RepID=A0A226CYC4_FOLCA|nr:DmX-like protein 2 [Folsomia candida]